MDNIDEREILAKVRQLLKVKDESQDDVLLTFINGAYQYLRNAITDFDKKCFTDNRALIDTAIIILTKEFYLNSKDKKDTLVLTGIITQLEYS